jgi:NADPH:quinone reductase
VLEHQAVRLPDNVPLEVGACLGIPAMTAFHAITLADPAPQQTVLVMGGAGAVGNYAIQFAKLRGAKVIATVSSDAKAAIARSAGADEVINYRTETLAERLGAMTSGHGADRIIEVDFLANAPLYPGLLAPHGSSIIYGTDLREAKVPAVWMLTHSITLRFFLIYLVDAATRTASAGEITRLLGKLHHNIDRVLPLERIVEAHEAVESGNLSGKLLLSLR